MFITFEGMDGSGKTTLMNHLKDKIKEKYPQLELILTREPGGTNLREAEEIRELILNPSNKISAVTEALLYTASRRVHLEQIIWPALKENKLIFCDRYVDSSYAYQGKARNLGIDWMKQLQNLVIENTIPDLTIFVDINDVTSEQRKLKRGNLNRLDQESKEFHKKVSQGYEDIINNERKRFIIVNGNLTIKEVVEETLSKLEKHPKFIKYLNLILNKEKEII